MDAPRPEGRPGLSRRRALMGGVAAGASAVAMRAAPAAAAEHDPGVPRNLVLPLPPLELTDRGPGPTLLVRQVTGGADGDPFPGGLAAGVAALGERFGVLGSTLLPQELAISELGPDMRAGVAGLGKRFGMLGSTLLPQELAISELGPDMRAGVAGLGRRFGVLGSTLLPRELAISIPADVGVSGIGHGVGVWGMVGAGRRPPRLAAAGVLGSATGDGTGVAAESESGFAIRSLGKLAFSTAGRGRITSGQRMGAVSNPAIQRDSLANVTLLGDPGNTATVQYVLPKDGLLEVHLTLPARRDTDFSYFLFHSLGD